MERILRIFTKETGSINQAALLLGILALAADILALFRDRSIAHFIGPSPQLDAYYAAFRVPDLIFVCIASLASITVLIPFISAKMRGGEVTKEAEKFLGEVFTVFLIGMILVAGILFFLMPHLIFFIAPGFTPAFASASDYAFPHYAALADFARAFQSFRHHHPAFSSIFYFFFEPDFLQSRHYCRGGNSLSDFRDLWFGLWSDSGSPYSFSDSSRRFALLRIYAQIFFDH